jgi:3-isopropylmalate/(R)-2-methylmalate dehydratase small subunit
MAEIVKIVKVGGTAVPMRGNDIDTDRVIPARYLKEVTFARMGDYPFFDERFDASGKKKDHPFNDPEYREHRFCSLTRTSVAVLHASTRPRRSTDSASK